jgi:hypothetical protein
MQGDNSTARRVLHNRGCALRRTARRLSRWIAPEGRVSGQASSASEYPGARSFSGRDTPAPRPPFTLDNELRVFASRSRCKNSVGLNAVGAEGSATAHGNFSRDRALEATTENRWKALGFALVAIARLDIAGAGPMDFVSRRQSGSLAAPGQMDARHGRGMHGLGGRIGRQSCTSWSLGPLRGELADGH